MIKLIHLKVFNGQLIILLMVVIQMLVMEIL